MPGQAKRFSGRRRGNARSRIQVVAGNLRLLLLRFLFGGLVLGLGLVLRLRLLLGLRLLLLPLVAVSGLGSMGRVLAVIGHIPAGALELHRWRRYDLLHQPAALRAFLHMWVGELLDLLKAVMALLALVLVKWHGFLVRHQLDAGRRLPILGAMPDAVNVRARYVARRMVDSRS